MRRSLRSGTQIALGVFVAVAVCVSGCGDDDPALPASRVTPAYLGQGPYPVASTTLELADRKVAIFYPALPGSEVGMPHAMYRQTDPLRDPILKSLAEYQARRHGINLDYEMRAFGQLPAASGRFPVLLFSHGFGGWQLVNSNLLVGIASWGFVIASPDHIERDLNAVATNNVHADVGKDDSVLLDCLRLLKDENAKVGGFLEGRVDAEHVAVAGHSAGGAAALGLIGTPEIQAVVGYAAVGSVSNPPSKPTLLIDAAGDIVVTRESTLQIFDALRSPKRFVEIERTGHNSFTDLCDAIRSGASLTQLVRDAGIPIDEQLLELAENGCAPADLNPSDCWAISQHLTVAHVRQAFGIDRVAVGLGPEIANAFVVPIEYQEVL